ncbi:MAG: hypothetical protein R3F61_04900 [Myxococcota bacterium]
MKVLLVSLVLLCSSASAQAVRTADMEGMSEAARLAEYNRLSGELHRYAERQTWVAVEQAYLGCIATGADMKLSDHFHAAHAAQVRGDMKATRERLGKALEVSGGNDRDLIEWLFAIDTTYSAVTITAYPGAVLSAERRPFDPVQSRAIDFAVQTLQQTGAFDGILPRGAYYVDGELIDIRMGKGAAIVTLEEPKARGKKRGPKPDKGPDRGNARR